MESVRVYKGMNTPLKIRGLYSRYFYICFASVLLVGFLLAFTVSDALRDNGGKFWLFECIIELAIPCVIYKILYKRSNPDKLPKKRLPMTISNRNIYKVLNHK